MYVFWLRTALSSFFEINWMFCICLENIFWISIFVIMWAFFLQELERKAAELQRKEQEMKNMQINGKLLIFYVDCENIMGFY